MKDRDRPAIRWRKQSLVRLALLGWIAFFAGRSGSAQDLAPRAYVVTPVDSNAVNLIYAFYSGSLDFNGALPIDGGSGRYSVPVVAMYHSLNCFGRSANVSANLPYGVGNFEGEVAGVERNVHRSGLLDAGARFSVNLFGGPAMELPKFAKWKQRSLLGASVRIVAPTGQYSSASVVNWGSNRWSFKPEIGYSYRWNKWVLDGYGGAWFYTANPARIAYPGPPQPQTLTPIGSFEGHLSRDIKPRLWFSLDGNFWSGGTSTLGGVTKPDTKQSSSRIGATVSFPISRRQSIKVSVSDGAYVRYGGDYVNVSASWQYSWLGALKR